jgi:hypothetical protein
MGKREHEDTVTGGSGRITLKRRRDEQSSPDVTMTDPPNSVGAGLHEAREKGSFLWQTIKDAASKECVFAYCLFRHVLTSSGRDRVLSI